MWQQQTGFNIGVKFSTTSHCIWAKIRLLITGGGGKPLYQADWQRFCDRWWQALVIGLDPGVRSAITRRLWGFDISPVLLAPSVQVSSWFPAQAGREDVCGYRWVHNHLPLFSALHQHTRQLPLSLCGWLWTQPQWPHHLQVHIR